MLPSRPSPRPVNIIGSVAVPVALIFPPILIIRALAFSPCPGLASIRVFAGIFNVAPSSTNTNPSRIYLILASRVISEVILPCKTISGGGSPTYTCLVVVLAKPSASLTSNLTV